MGVLVLRSKLRQRARNPTAGQPYLHPWMKLGIRCCACATRTHTRTSRYRSVQAQLTANITSEPGVIQPRARVPLLWFLAVSAWRYAWPQVSAFPSGRPIHVSALFPFYLRHHSYSSAFAIRPSTRLMVSSPCSFSKILFSCPVASPIVIQASLRAVTYGIYVRPHLLQ